MQRKSFASGQNSTDAVAFGNEDPKNNTQPGITGVDSIPNEQTQNKYSKNNTTFQPENSLMSTGSANP